MVVEKELPTTVDKHTEDQQLQGPMRLCKFRSETPSHFHHGWVLPPHGHVLLWFSSWRQEVLLLWGLHLLDENPQLDSGLVWDLYHCRIPTNHLELCCHLTLSCKPCTW